MFLGGRGAGKTRTGAEWIREQVKAGVKRIGVIAPTSFDLRNVIVEGNSGILAVCWEGDLLDSGRPMGAPRYEPSKRQVAWKECGAVVHLYSAEEPNRLRGPQHEKIWGDEVCAWKDASIVWDMAMFGLRLGTHPQILVTTTPKPITLIRELFHSPKTAKTHSTSWENRAHLPAKWFEEIVEKYRGTRLGVQELEGLLIEEDEGALWRREDLERSRVTIAKGTPHSPDAYQQALGVTFKKVVVALDPTVAEDPHGRTAGHCGIVVAALGTDGHGYVLEDASGRFTPHEWASKAVMLYNKWGADKIVAEGNQGGAMVRLTLRTVWEDAPIRMVLASRGKVARAEPVSALYEQDKVHHVGFFKELEDQLCTWTPDQAESPDRLDALVWALTDLIVSRAPTIRLGTPVAVLGSPIATTYREDLHHGLDSASIAEPTY